LACCGRCDRCFCWWFFGRVNILLYQKSCVWCASLLMLLPAVWITPSIVSDVIVHYDNHPLTASGIHVIVKADLWALWRIIRRLRLPIRAWDEPRPPLTSVLANPLIVPGPISAARAPDCVIQPATISQLHHWQALSSCLWSKHPCISKGGKQFLAYTDHRILKGLK
jgi:hypothetical protein